MNIENPYFLDRKHSKFSQPLFLPVQIKPEQEISSSADIKSMAVLMEVTLNNGCYLRFPSTIDTQELTKITTALTERC